MEINEQIICEDAAGMTDEEHKQLQLYELVQYQRIEDKITLLSIVQLVQGIAILAAVIVSLLR